MLKPTRDDYYYNASNHCNCAAAAGYDDDIDALLKRLLIEAWHRHPASRLVNQYRFSQASCPPDATVKMAALRFLCWLFGGLRLFFFYLADHRRDSPQFLAVTEIHQFYAHGVAAGLADFFHAGTHHLAFVSD